MFPHKEVFCITKVQQSKNQFRTPTTCFAYGLDCPLMLISCILDENESYHFVVSQGSNCVFHLAWDFQMIMPTQAVKDDYEH